MPDTALPSLLSRIEAATGADREIDAAVCLALGGRQDGKYWLNPGDDHDWYLEPSPVSSSCDARRISAAVTRRG